MGGTERYAAAEEHRKATRPIAPPTPLVTVVLSAWGRARHTVRAIDSVRRQTLGDWELIVVPDVSPEALLRLVAAFDDERITVLDHADPRGRAPARNSAIVQARAPYTAFLNSDSEWAPAKLERQLQLQRAAKARWSYTNFRVADESGVEAASAGDGPWLGCAGWIVEPLLHLLPGIAAPTVIVETDLLREAGSFDPECNEVGDFDLWLRLASLAPAAAVDDALATLAPSAPATADDMAPLLSAFLRTYDTHARRTTNRRELKIAERQGARFSARLADLLFARGDRLGGLRAVAGAFVRHPLNEDWMPVLGRWLLRSLPATGDRPVDADVARFIPKFSEAERYGYQGAGVEAPAITGAGLARVEGHTVRRSGAM